MKRILIILMLISYTLVACQKEEILTQEQETNIVNCKATSSFQWQTSVTTTGNTYSMFYNTTINANSQLIIAIHEGAFIGGNYTNMLPTNLLAHYEVTEQELCDNNIAYVTIDYKLANTNPQGLNNTLADIYKTIEEIRGKATLYNFNPDNIILFGVSSGASAALRIALVQSNNVRLNYIKGLICVDPQASLDIITLRSTVFKDYTSYYDYEFNRPDIQALLYPLYLTTNPQVILTTSQLMHYNYLNELDVLDPPILLINTRTDFLHHPLHTKAIKDKYTSICNGNCYVSYSPVSQLINAPSMNIINFCNTVL